MGEIATDKEYIYPIWNPPLGIHSEARQNSAKPKLRMLETFYKLDTDTVSQHPISWNFYINIKAGSLHLAFGDER